MEPELAIFCNQWAPSSGTGTPTNTQLALPVALPTCNQMNTLDEAKARDGALTLHVCTGSVFCLFVWLFGWLVWFFLVRLFDNIQCRV